MFTQIRLEEAESELRPEHNANERSRDPHVRRVRKRVSERTVYREGDEPA